MSGGEEKDERAMTEVESLELGQSLATGGTGDCNVVSRRVGENGIFSKERCVVRGGFCIGHLSHG